MDIIEREIIGLELAIIMEDNFNYYIDLGIGEGRTTYSKDLFTLDEAINAELEVRDWASKIIFQK